MAQNLSRWLCSRSFLAVLAVLVALPLALSPLGLPTLALEPGAAASPQEPAARPRQGPVTDADWREVDRLVAEQKFQAAAELVAGIRERARAQGDQAALAHALIREVQLRTGLHGYETAVRFLREQPWPESGTGHAALELFYAQSLVNYLQAYSWEIGQREQVVSREAVDLKAWTREQLVAEAVAAFDRVYGQRAQWGSAPVGELAPYLSQNDYPPRIRGTLRDTVTYLWVELLADTSLWDPVHANEVYKLDLERLLSEDPAELGDVELTSASVHPLEKIAAVLCDLESWHKSSGRPEAAFEARLERLRRLWAALPSENSRRPLRERLRRDLDELTSRYEWWSMGMSVLAEFVREGSEPDALVRARAIALEGHAPHPNSPGGQRCLHLTSSIEAPEYHLTSMTSDGPGQRSIEVSHRNLGTLYFRVYALDLVREIERSQDYSLLPSYREIEEIVGSGRPAAEWQVTLPSTRDYRDHRTFVTPPLERPGLYLVLASTRSDFRERSNRLAAVHLMVTDLVILNRDLDGAAEVTVHSGRSGWALAGVEVSAYRADWQSGHRAATSAVTDQAGLARFDLLGRGDRNYFFVARLGSDVALDDNFFHPYRRQDPESVTSALIYTDRSVYRPLQSLHWKVVAYRGRAAGGSYRTLPGEQVTVELVDPNGEPVASATVKTNSYGSASGELTIPAGRLLGAWHLRSSLGGHAAVQVEEYKRPTFEVTLEEPGSPLRLNRPARLTGLVRYYFGLPVVTGTVGWRVEREPVYPRWWWYGWSRGGGVQSQVVAAGAAELDADGRFAVEFTPEAEETDAAAGSAGLTYRYRLSADVTDEGGETRSATRAFRLGLVAVEAAIESEQGFVLAGSRSKLTIRRSDLDGTPRAGQGSFTLIRLVQPEATLLPADQPLPEVPNDPSTEYRTPGDEQRSRFAHDYDPEGVLRLWSDGAVLEEGSVLHDASGVGTVELPALEPGAYRLRYSTTDDFGARYETARELVVAGPAATALALPAVLLAERSSLLVGDTARLLVHSGLADQELVLELFRDGVRFDRRRLDSRRGLEVVEIAVDERLRGGFGASLTAVRDHQLMRQEARIFVPWDDRRLALSFESFRDRLRPGERETWRVKIAGADGHALEQGAAELLAYMYDRSLDLFAPHQPNDPLQLYPNRAAVGSLQSSLGAVGEAWSRTADFPALPFWPVLTGDRLTFFDSYAIGGVGRGGGGDMRMSRMVLSGVAPAPPSAAPQEQIVVSSEAPELEAMTTSATATMAQGVAKVAPATPEPPAQGELRSDFSETAFFLPHLVAGPGGEVAFEFTVPDSVTEWNVWVHALTTDLRGGSLQQQTRSVKELMVRPYLPRFLREGDEAELEVVVNNASERPLSGKLSFDIVEPDTGESLLAAFGLDAAAAVRDFSVEPGGGTSLGFPIGVPARVGSVAFRVMARAGDLADGELRPVPVLPGRIHLTQSRFVTLTDRDRRVLRFAELASDDDPTRRNDQMVVTLDAQLFYSVLSALPYLVSYSYECTEQTLNRFLSTGILTSLYDQYPAVARMADQLKARETRFETFDQIDPNRKMLLEETPWLRQARGGDGAESEELLNVLDPRIADAQRRSALAKLEQAQTSLGGFPWWPGGPPSPYMTLYLVDGFSRALEFGVEVPQQMVQRAWSYLHRHYLDTWAAAMVEEECCWESITYLNYVLSSYPQDAAESWTGGVFTADDRQKMLGFSFRHWREHSPRLKAYLALTLKRAGRAADADLVWDSIMDSARTTQDEGTFWAPEDRAWLWYNDTIESHALVLRGMTELHPDDARRHGLVHWLLLNKKLNHWKSTRATAEVLYALVHYLEREGALGVRESARVSIGPRLESFVWEPDTYTGKRNQLVVSGEDLDARTMSEVVVEKETKGLLFASANWSFSTDRLPEEAEGDFFRVERRYFKRVLDGQSWRLEPLAEGAALEPGDQVEVQLSLRSKHAAEYVHLRDPRGAGFEPETTASGYRWDLGIGWYEEVRDSGTNFFFEWLPVGEYTFRYRLRAAVAGRFKVAPATVQSMYASEFTAYSAGARLSITASVNAR